MLRSIEILRWIAFLVAVVLVLTLGGLAYYSSQLPSSPEKQQSAEENAKASPEGQKNKTLWHSIFPDTISFFTFWLGVFTGALALVAILQLNALNRAERIAEKTAEAAKQSADVAHDSLVSTQRAFVFFKHTQFTGVFDYVGNHVVRWKLAAIWENSGTTPVQFMQIHVNVGVRTDELPDNFDFPDFGKRSTSPVPLGPKAIVPSVNVDVSVEDMQAIKDGRKRLFFWGWAEYDDIFKGSHRHRTEFCNEITVGGDPTTKDRVSFGGVLCAKHNGSDNERTKPFQTDSPKTP
jgi:hypothetical protein